MKQDIQLTIGIPSFCEPQILIRLLKSLEKAGIATLPVETIIIDDCHPADLTNHVEKIFTWPVCLKNKTRIGPSKTRNIILNKAKGSHAAFLDADCIVPKDWIKNALASLCPDTLIAGKVLRPDNSLEWGPRKTTFLGVSVPCSINKANVGSSNNLIVPVSVIKHFGGFNEDLEIYFEDSFLCICANRSGFRVQYKPELLVYHHHNSRMNPLRISKFWRNKTLAMLNFYKGSLFCQILFLLGSIFLLFLYAMRGLLHRKPEIINRSFEGFIKGVKDYHKLKWPGACGVGCLGALTCCNYNADRKFARSPQTLFTATRVSLERALIHSENNDFAGYSKHDGLNSPILSRFSCKKPLLRLVAIQAVMRSPIDLRTLLFTKKERNPCGIAYFCLTYINLYRITGDDTYLKKARPLFKWLLSHSALSLGLKNQQNGEPFHGHCWGYNHSWQSTGFYAPSFYPNLIVTVFAAEAFLLMYLATKEEKWFEISLSSLTFIQKDIPILFESNKSKCISYIPGENNLKVININALAAAFISKIYTITGDLKHKAEAKSLINFVDSSKTDYNSWYYTIPANQSMIVHDNYHTAEICDAFLEYSIFSGDLSYCDTYKKALDYYKKELFTKKGEPKWQNNRKYPFDINGASHGIYVFKKATIINQTFSQTAEKTLTWTLMNMQRRDGSFYYRKGRFFYWRHRLMRWNNALTVLNLSRFCYMQILFEKNQQNPDLLQYALEHPQEFIC